MILKEILYFPLNPRGIFCIRRAQDNQKFRILQCPAYVLRKIRRDSQFLLIPENTGKPAFSAFLPHLLRYMIPLQFFVNCFRHENIQLFVRIADKCIIFLTAVIITFIHDKAPPHPSTYRIIVYELPGSRNYTAAQN